MNSQQFRATTTQPDQTGYASDGYIDTEALADQIYLDGEKNDWIETHAYVDLIGFGMKQIDPKDQSD